MWKCFSHENFKKTAAKNLNPEENETLQALSGVGFFS
jgi:hypothetical protein